MTVAKTERDIDIRFVEVPYKCKCGYEGKETILVSNNVGILDTRCEKCNRRIVEARIIDTEEVHS
ncbi:hypothetical protein [Persephonella sp. IF05-L8]|uniref:hypothetical protein n=1 Tax=Persephonella sp. IF05-L8 TaxID=1158338 RepID=UPI00049690F6